MAAFCAVTLTVSAVSCDNGSTLDPVDTEEETPMGTTPTSRFTNAVGTLHYQWVMHGNDWEAATDVNVGNDAEAYIPQTADAGKYISVTVSSSGNTGSVKKQYGD